MFQKSKLFFWTMELLAISLIVFLWQSFGDYLAPFVSVFQTFLVPVVIAFFLYYMMNPLVEWIEQKTKLSRVWAVFLALLGVMGLLIWGILSLLPNVIQQLTDLISSAPTVFGKIESLIQSWASHPALQTLDFDAMTQQLNLSYTDILKNVLSTVTVSLNSLLSTVTSFLMNLAMVPILLFYLLADGEKFLPMIERNILKRDNLKIAGLLTEMNRTLSRYISGVSIDAGIIFLFALVGYSVIGLPYALVFALCAAVFNIIPYIGPTLGLIPMVIGTAFTEPQKALIAVIYMLIVQQIDGNIIYPRVVGGAMKVHPVTIMVLLVLGGNIYGMLGMIIAIPVYSVLKEIVKFIWNLYQSHRKPQNML